MRTTRWFAVGQASGSDAELGFLGLTHAVKHTPMSTVRVGVELTDRVLRMDLRDDGVGGDGPRGPGLVGLRDRMAALAGTITVVSPPGAGTTIIAEVPIDGR